MRIVGCRYGVQQVLLNLPIITMQRVPFSLWSKDAGVLIEVAGGKEAGEGKYAIGYMCEWYYNVNPPSFYKRRGMNSQIYIYNI